MTRLRQKYKNLKKRLEQPVKVARIGMPGVLTLEHDQMFSRYEFTDANVAHQPIIFENAVRGLCEQIIKDGLLEIETTEDPYGMIVVKCRLRVIPPIWR